MSESNRELFDESLTEPKNESDRSRLSLEQLLESVAGHDRPIHLPGSIQPHGVLLALSEPDLEILQVSDNTLAVFGIAPDVLLGRRVNCLLSVAQVTRLQNLCRQAVSPENAAKNLSRGRSLKLTLATPDADRQFDVIVHRSHDALILELEPTDTEQEWGFAELHDFMRGAIAQFQKAAGLVEFVDLLAIEARKLTGFDRVMVYRFDHQGSGVVIAEAKQEDLQPSHLDLHYPATDLPEQSRQLYQYAAIRYIPDLAAAPVPLVPVEHPETEQPLDLRASVLRSADPCCVTFHGNMGVAGLIVTPLVKDQQLWGLIACHHQTVQFIPYERRAALEFLGQIASLELSNQVRRQDLDYEVRLKSLQSEFVETLAQSDDILAALIQPSPSLLATVNAQGAAICLADEITLVGNTPAPAAVRSLIDWIDPQIKESLFHTNALPKLYPEALAYKDQATGLLVMRLSKAQRYYILWFRPEVVQTVTWAGDPNEALQVEPDGSLKLCPRSSFEQWQEIVRLTALPWQSCEIDSALNLRSTIVGVVLKKTDELAKINTELAKINQELERSNRELDSFAFAASHDLKEPLRGIYNYATILLEDYTEVLDAEGKEYLQSLVNLTQRMDTLISVLLQFSQLGQTELRLQPTDLNEVLDRILETFQASRPDLCFDLTIPRSLPLIECDPVLVTELFSNLISNAFKYNDKPRLEVEIGYRDGTPEPVVGAARTDPDPAIDPEADSESKPQTRLSRPVFYVRDNGIGIRSHHQETVFRLFKRLHSQEKYGGGAGAGLAIAKKIVERHGGRIWVESIPGSGSTFCFTLS